MTNLQKISPCLWFDGQAEDAARFYVSIFGDSGIGETIRTPKATAVLSGRPEGSVMTVEFRIGRESFTALNGGPYFKFTPAISFFVSCVDVREAEETFARLAEDGTALMPLQRYPFSEKYGWVADRYGASWQINAVPHAQAISPCLMFVGEQCGRAEEAMRFYASIFPDSRIAEVWRYGAEDRPNAEGTIKHAVFSLNGQEFRAMESALDHRFTFSEAISFQVHCDTQAEIDHFWTRLAEGGDPKAQQCGWLKDRFGVSWQVIPKALSAMMRHPDSQKVERVTNALLQMKKLDIAALERAFEGQRP